MVNPKPLGLWFWRLGLAAEFSLNPKPNVGHKRFLWRHRLLLEGSGTWWV